MKRITSLTALLCIVVGVFAQLNVQNLNLSVYYQNNYSLSATSAAAPMSVEVFQAFQDSIQVFENEWVYKNMRIYPIVANEEYQSESAKNTNYLSLQQAFKKEVIQVSEISSGGQVNTLLLSNSGSDTILIMAGEVVLGGKQDRALGQEMLLLPGANDVRVKVFCVESGRWEQGRTGTNFNGYYGFAGNHVRKKVVVEKNQGAVWGKIGEAHTKAGVSSSTGSFKDIKNSEDYSAQLLQYKGYFLPKLMEVENLLGFVVVSGDKILGMEAFASQEMLTKQLDKLLESYVTEAIQEGGEITVTTAQVDEYMKNALDETKQDEIIKNQGTELKVNDKKLHISVLEK